MDNYAPHRHPRVVEWFARRPRFHVHYTPRRMSWVNAAELVFARMARSRVRGVECRSVIEFQMKVKAFVLGLNASPQPFPMADKGRPFSSSLSAFRAEADAGLVA